MIVLGIDPGQTGGLVLLDTEGIRKAIPTPLIYPTKKPTLATTPLLYLFDGYYETTADYAVIENVHAMPAQGVSSSFQFGRMFGAIEAAAGMYANEIIYVTPQKWKKHFGLLKTDKNASMAKATELYGNEHWGLKKHEGVAEAALIATWGLHQLTKE